MIHKSHMRSVLRPGSVRLAALVLTALTLFTALLARPVRAAEWMQPYLEQVQAWGVLRGDANGDLHEDRAITRAEFVVMMNRAFGYTDVGPNPFSDVDDNAWYAEDIRIAHQAGYFQGADGAALPMNLVTREQAAVLLGRCLRFQGVTGAAGSTFTDMQQIGGWSRPYVQEAAELGIIQGYGDGSFKPKLPITRGQMACFLVRALGTLVQEPGEQTSGGVYGNLTITTPGVKLKDTTITGNLYLTGGVGLGDVELENVNVLGKIVITGGGEAEGGQHSVILRNVTAGSLEVDSLTEQFLSIMAEGLTSIGTTTVRTSAYVEDRTDDGLGFQTLRLDGVEGSQFQLAGNIKRVVDLTPKSTLQVAQGVADTVTIDEKALDVSLIIDNIANIRELNLDTAAKVTGDGSIGHLNINAPGSDVSMLPDTIYVRPGITGKVDKVDMDNKVANESSADPRLLAGYPVARNIAPTSADAVFRTNKAGTIHWAVTALMDGSLGEEELMDPGSYPRIVRSGTLNATAANTDFTARLTGLTKEGSYYISALLVDARGRRSPVKVAAFTTPDDTAPNFAAGYPQDPILTTDADGEQVAQIMVMPTKDCQLYYVLLPKGSTAPTPADFRAAALPGNLGFGVVTVRKNTPFLISRINTSYLQEKTDYDLYLWLNDADNGKSSAVRKVTVTTKDITPPTLLRLEATRSEERTVTLAFEMDEPGTLSWFVTKRDQSVGINKESPTRQDQIMIENAMADGTRILRRGGPVRAASASTTATFTVTGLEGQTSYDLYYMIKDIAGNYGIYTKSIEFPLPIKTRDNQGPEVEVTFSHADEDPTTGARTPRANTDLTLDFSEVVRGTYKEGNVDVYDEFYELYTKVQSSTGEAREQAKNNLAQALRRYITLYPGTPPTRGDPTTDPVTDTRGNLSAGELDALPSWIDYREAQVTQTGAKTLITFPGDNSKNQANNVTPAVKLQSGESYYFRLEGIEDTSFNPMKAPPPNVAYTPKFTTAYAIIHMKELKDELTVTMPDGTTKNARIFSMRPEGTEAVPAGTRWDMLIWTRFNMRYDLLIRESGSLTWTLLGRVNPNPNNLNPRVFNSLDGNFLSQLTATGLVGDPGGNSYPLLNDFTRTLEFAIVPEDTSYNTTVTMDIQVYAGANADIQAIARSQGTQNTLTGQNVTAINDIEPFTLTFQAPDRVPGVWIPVDGATVGSSRANIDVNLESPGTVYYFAVKLNNVTLGADGLPTGATWSMDELDPAYNGAKPNLADVPIAGATREPMTLDPYYPDVFEIATDSPVVRAPTTTKTGNTGQNMWGTSRGDTLSITGLAPESTYLLYLVPTSVEGTPPSSAVCYQFTTTPARAPAINITPGGTTADILFKDVETGRPMESVMAYVLVRSDFFTTLPSNEFSRPMRNYMDPDKAIDFDGTVLDAMQQEGNAQGLSVFDICASDSAKTAFGNIIRSEYNRVFRINTQPYYLENATGTGNDFDSGRAYTERTLSFTLTDSNDYVLLVTARGTNSDIPGFRASWTYRRTQVKYLSVSPSLPGTDGSRPNTYSGQLILSFNSDLRYILASTDEETKVPLDTCRPGNSSHALDVDDHVGDNGQRDISTQILYLADGVQLIDPAISNSGSHGATIGDRLIFRLTDVAQGRVIDFGTRLTGSDTTTRLGTHRLAVDIERNSETGQWNWKLADDAYLYSDR